MSDQTPSLAEFAKLLDSRLDSVKADLSKSINDQAINLENSIKNNIDRAVQPIIKRQDEYEEKNDNRFKKLDECEEMNLKRFQKLENHVAGLTKLIKDTNESRNSPSECTVEYPPLPLLPSLALRPAISAPLTSTPPSPRPHVSGDLQTIRELVKDAKCVIGIGPMYDYHYDKFSNVEPSEKVRLAALDALRLELNVKETEIAEADIANTFLPIRTPKVPRVYIRFHKQEHADLCLKLAKSLKNSDAKIFRYFPRQFQARVRALEDVAYPLRKNSVPKNKTEIVYTEDDVQLMVCPQGGVYYQPYHVPHLPPIDTTPARSPPQGRPRPKRGRSANSDSGSPPDGRKASRHISPLN